MDIMKPMERKARNSLPTLRSQGILLWEGLAAVAIVVFAALVLGITIAWGAESDQPLIQVDIHGCYYSVYRTDLGLKVSTSNQCPVFVARNTPSGLARGASSNKRQAKHDRRN